MPEPQASLTSSRVIATHSSMSIRYQAQSVTAPRALGGDSWQVSLAQQEDRLDCETLTGCSPASPSFASSDSVLSTPFSDAVKEATALTMQPSIGNNNTNYLQHHSSRTDSALKNEPRVDDPAMMASSYELDRDMMNMLVNLNAGPPRAPVANWGFEPTPTEAQAFYDPETFMSGTSNQPTPLSGSVMMTPSTSADMTHLMNMTVAETDFGASRPMANNTSNNAMEDPFSSIDSSFVMPYQDCATLPVGDFPLQDGCGMYKSAFENTNISGATGMDQFTSPGPHAVDNQLGENSVPFFGSNGVSQTIVEVDPAFHGAIGSTNGNLFNEVAQPPAASMAVINGGFAMPDLSLQEDDDSDWNGSSSGFSTVSSSPIANNAVPTSLSSTPANAAAQLASPQTAKPSATNNGTKKPKRIRRLCSVAGCGKRARSQDLCIAHGGGRRCMVEGCEKSSQGGNMCIKHGGGKRCKHPGCDKAAQTNSLCKAHGGGPRCQFPGCTKSSQGGGFCRAHGGGKRCAAQGCNKGTQRGDFCALHGGSRFCEVPGCMRNDRGGGFCAHHGGGKRCNIANCNRSCRRSGLCSTHLRLLGHEVGSKVADVETDGISVTIPTGTGVTSV